MLMKFLNNIAPLSPRFDYSVARLGWRMGFHHGTPKAPAQFQIVIVAHS